MWHGEEAPATSAGQSTAHRGWKLRGADRPGARRGPAVRRPTSEEVPIDDEQPSGATVRFLPADVAITARRGESIVDAVRRHGYRTRRRLLHARRPHRLRARHGITRGETIYFFDPSRNRNEIFAGGYRTGADFRTITWTMDRAGQGINYTHRELDEDFLKRRHVSPPTPTCCGSRGVGSARIKS